MADVASQVVALVQAVVAALLVGFCIKKLNGEPFDGAVLFLGVFLFTLAQMTFFMRMGVDLPVEILQGLYTQARRAGLVGHIERLKEQLGLHDRSSPKSHGKSPAKEHQGPAKDSHSKDVTQDQLHLKLAELRMENTRTLRGQPAFTSATLCLLLGLGFLAWDVVASLRDGKKPLSSAKLAVLGLLLSIVVVEAVVYFTIVRRTVFLTQTELLKHLSQVGFEEVVQQLRRVWNQDPWKFETQVEKYADKLLMDGVNLSGDGAYKFLRDAERQLVQQIKTD